MRIDTEKVAANPMIANLLIGFGGARDTLHEHDLV